MKILKTLLFLVIALVIVGAAGMLIQKDYDVHRNIQIDASPNMVSNYVSDFQNWPNWIPWADLDSNIAYEFGEQTQGENASYSWAGNSDVGSGSMTIARYVEGESMNTNITFNEPWESTSNGYWFFTEEDGKTSVTWGITGKAPILMTAMMGMEEMIGKSFERGLEKLQGQIESMEPEKKPIVWEEVMVEATPYFYTEEELAWKDISSELFGKHYGMIGAQVGEAMTGMPRVEYHVWDEENQRTKMRFAIPTNIKKMPKPPVMSGTSYGGMALKSVYMGPYEGTGDVHMSFDGYAEANGYEFASAPWEVFVTDPGNEPDPNKWITEIYYPVTKKTEVSE